MLFLFIFQPLHFTNYQKSLSRNALFSVLNAGHHYAPVLYKKERSKTWIFKKITSPFWKNSPKLGHPVKNLPV